MGFAYLFERYPSFTQTFCVREVLAMRDMGYEFPIFAIHTPEDELSQNYQERALENIIRLPGCFDKILASDTGFRRQARKWQAELEKIWGHDQAEKHRIYEALWLGAKCRELGIRHVHTHFASLAARTAFWLHRIFGVKFSVTAHANDIFRDEPPERLAQIFAAATVVVTVSDYSVQYLQEKFPALAQKFRRVYNGIEMASFKPSIFPNGRALIVSVGRYIEKKGFGHLVDACAHLARQDYECWIIGQGPLENVLRQRVAQLGITDHVRITGPKSEDEIRNILSQARMFVLPCLNASDGAKDNLPTVIMEAMAAGLPVISTPVAGVPEMVVNEVTGYLVPESNPQMLADRIMQLLNDSSLARILGERGFERCRELFDLKNTSERLSEILSEHGAFHSQESLGGKIARLFGC